MHEADTTFTVGEVVGLHALDGTLKIRPKTNNPGLLLSVKSVTVVMPDGEKTAAHVKKIKHERRMIFLSLKEYADRTAAEKLVGATVSTERSQLRKLDKDEWWSKDLIGLAVYSTNTGALLGTVSDIVGPMGEYLEIKRSSDPDGEPSLVPFVKGLVPTVDLKRGKIEVVDIPGLLD